MSEVTSINDVALQTKYGIAETFTSLQGEGLYTGTKMHFVRFSGCSVGKKLSEEERGKWTARLVLDRAEEAASRARASGGNKVVVADLLKVIPPYIEQCTLYDGRNFLCDTNFQTSKAMSVQQILDEIPKGVERICLTGGEPLDRNLTPLLKYIGRETNYQVHIETSGTKDIRESCTGLYVDDPWSLWITVAPKKGALPYMLESANELKLLVDEHFDSSKLPQEVFDHELVWLQPVNGEWDVDMANVQRCLKILEEHPKWRLSMQMHKIWRVR